MLLRTQMPKYHCKAGIEAVASLLTTKFAVTKLFLRPWLCSVVLNRAFFSKFLTSEIDFTIISVLQDEWSVSEASREYRVSESSIRHRLQLIRRNKVHANVQNMSQCLPVALDSVRNGM